MKTFIITLLNHYKSNWNQSTWFISHRNPYHPFSHFSRLNFDYPNSNGCRKFPPKSCDGRSCEKTLNICNFKKIKKNLGHKFFHSEFYWTLIIAFDDEERSTALSSRSRWLHKCKQKRSPKAFANLFLRLNSLFLDVYFPNHRTIGSHSEVQSL